MSRQRLSPCGQTKDEVGLSPPVRGSLIAKRLASVAYDAVYPRPCGGALLRPDEVTSEAVHGSIPARAGEPSAAAARIGSILERSIPARAGEPIWSYARGRSMPAGGLEHRLGSIPARAGEPSVKDPRWTTMMSEVYPRPCGGAACPLRDQVGLRIDGSIPARAGEPAAGTRRLHLRVVDGLSPPVRGSRPGSQDRRSAWKVVYPRPCGGARVPARHSGIIRGRGLSPPVRGSPLTMRLVNRYPRPAGEPRASSPTAGLSPPVRGSLSLAVYPHVRGSGIGPIGAGPGLSPPVRGSPDGSCNRMPLGDTGSIPARAGEPTRQLADDMGRRRGLSPPVRGSRSKAPLELQRGPDGLSPPVRGSHLRQRKGDDSTARVYPRPCGGALIENGSPCGPV